MKITDKWAFWRQRKRIRNLPEVTKTDPKNFEKENTLQLCTNCGTRLDNHAACPKCCEHDYYTFRFDHGPDAETCINCGDSYDV